MKEGRTWLERDQVLYIHDQIIEQFGGSHGIRNVRLLESAIARPQQLDAYGQPDIHELAASLTAGIAQNHPFIDGNKRTSITAARVFLQQNGQELASDKDDQRYNLIVGFASGRVTETDIAAHYRENATPIIDRIQERANQSDQDARQRELQELEAKARERSEQIRQRHLAALDQRHWERDLNR